MAFKIPVVKSRQQLPGQLGTPRATASQFGAEVGAGLMDAGSALSKRNALVASRQAKLQERKDKLGLQEWKNILSRENDRMSIALGGNDNIDYDTEADTFDNNGYEGLLLSSGIDTSKFSAEKNASFKQIYDSNANSYLGTVATAQVKQLRTKEKAATDEAVAIVAGKMSDTPLGTDLSVLSDYFTLFQSHLGDTEEARDAFGSSLVGMMKTQMYNNSDDPQAVLDSINENKKEYQKALGSDRYNDLMAVGEQLKNDVKTGKDAKDVQDEKEKEAAAEITRGNLDRGQDELNAGKGDPIKLIDDIRSSGLNSKEQNNRVNKVNKTVKEFRTLEKNRRKDLEAQKKTTPTYSTETLNGFLKTASTGTAPSEATMNKAEIPVEKQNQVLAKALEAQQEKQKEIDEFPSDPASMRVINKYVSRAKYYDVGQLSALSANISKSYKEGYINKTDYITSLKGLQAVPVDRQILDQYYADAYLGQLDPVAVRASEVAGSIPEGTITDLNKITASAEKASGPLKKEIGDMRYEITVLNFGEAEFEALTTVNQWFLDNPTKTPQDARAWFEPVLQRYKDENASWVVQQVKALFSREPISRTQIQ